MKYYIAYVVIRDDGKVEETDPVGAHYLSRDELRESLRSLVIPMAGVDLRLVSLMECARPHATIYNSQAEDRDMVDFSGKMKSRGYPEVEYGMSGQVIDMMEVFRDVDETVTGPA